MITTTSLLHKQDYEKAASIKTVNARRFTSIKFCVLSNILFPLRNHLIRPSVFSTYYQLFLRTTDTTAPDNLSNFYEKRRLNKSLA